MYSFFSLLHLSHLIPPPPPLLFFLTYLLCLRFPLLLLILYYYSLRIVVITIPTTSTYDLSKWNRNKNCNLLEKPGRNLIGRETKNVRLLWVNKLTEMSLKFGHELHWSNELNWEVGYISKLWSSHRECPKAEDWSVVGPAREKVSIERLQHLLYGSKYRTQIGLLVKNVDLWELWRRY